MIQTIGDGELVIGYKTADSDEWRYADLTRADRILYLTPGYSAGEQVKLGFPNATYLKTITGNIYNVNARTWVKDFSKITVSEYTRKEDASMSQRLTEALDAIPLESGHPGHPTPLAESALDMQEGGSHYKTFPIQPVEYITRNSIPYLEGNVIKYVSRHSTKNGIEDIKKAIHYLQLIAELRYGINLTAPK